MKHWECLEDSLVRSSFYKVCNELQKKISCFKIDKICLEIAFFFKIIGDKL